MAGLGDIAAVWTWQSFATALLFGFGFGYLVIASITAQERWKTGNTPKAVGWLVGVLTAYFLVGLAVTQIGAALAVNDFEWTRIVSRLGPQLAASVGVGFGTWRGLHRAGHR